MIHAGNELSPEARCSPIKMHEHRGLACSDSSLVKTENQPEFFLVSLLMTFLIQLPPLCFVSSFILHETCRDSEPRHREHEGGVSELNLKGRVP